jgi:hypothetical protein
MPPAVASRCEPVDSCANYLPQRACSFPAANLIRQPPALAGTDRDSGSRSFD